VQALQVLAALPQYSTEAPHKQACLMNIGHHPLLCPNHLHPTWFPFRVFTPAAEATLMGRSIVGTPHYLSPEMCENKPYGKKSDVWALGCILAEMCLLAKPFNASSISTIILRILRGQYPQLPDCYSADLKALVARLLSPHPDQRPYVTELLQMPYVRCADGCASMCGCACVWGERGGEGAHCTWTEHEAVTLMVEP
jgi:serine/threonine protein kinase